MKKLVAVFSLLASACGSVACAQCPPGEGSSCKYDFYRNRMWPAPFTAADTLAVTSIFDQQRANGWRLHNTLSSSMFDPTTNCLTAAGRAHVKWIVSQAPQDRPCGIRSSGR